MLFLLLQIADFQCQMTCSKQGQAVTGGTGDGEMEFPFAYERLFGIKSNLSHLLIVVDLAARQIAASCASSLLPSIFKAKLLFVQHYTNNDNEPGLLSLREWIKKSTPLPLVVLFFFINWLQSNALKKMQLKPEDVIHLTKRINLQRLIHFHSNDVLVPSTFL